jgi:acid stress chaperone HdeB
MAEVRIVTNITSIVAGLLLCLMTVPSALSGITIDVSKITCKEFMFDTVTLPDNIAYWLSGYYNGKRGNTVFDITALRDYVNEVERYCLQNQDMTVMKAAETVLNVNK